MHLVSHKYLIEILKSECSKLLLQSFFSLKLHKGNYQKEKKKKTKPRLEFKRLVRQIMPKKESLIAQKKYEKTLNQANELLGFERREADRIWDHGAARSPF